MKGVGVALTLGVALLISACGKQGNSPSPPPNLKSPAATATTANPAGPAKAAEKPGKGTRLNQDSAEAEDKPDTNNSAGDTVAHNPLLAAVASTVTGSSSASAQALAGPTPWQEGVNYTRLVPSQPIDAPAGQVEVLEFFWYACPHCKGIDPLVATWKKNNPPWITFTRVPVLWNDGHRALAQMFYTLSLMGKLSDEVHAAIFKEIHNNGNPLIGTDPANTESNLRVQAAFVKSLGISESDFRSAYNQMGVLSAMRHADELAQRYRISGVPTFVVNGKYVADVASAGGNAADAPEKLVALVGDLAAVEHKR